MNKFSAGVLAKTDAVESFNPRLWGLFLLGAGVLLIASGLRDRTGPAPHRHFLSA
jgi:hypothetical protein